MIPITTHTIVKNEENWVWYSLVSVRDYVSRMLVVDDGSTDRTAEIIKSISDPKIEFADRVLGGARAYTEMRDKMVKMTKTDWFILLDGDEVWNAGVIRKFLEFVGRQGKNIWAVAMRTRNCIGDVYHYLPEEAGKYEILGRRGHLTIRAYRKLPGFHWEGEYPLERYCDPKGVAVNDQPAHLAFFEGFYWHMSALSRSSVPQKVKGWRAKKIEQGIPVTDDRELPEVFSLPRPAIVPSPWRKMSLREKLVAGLVTPAKRLRRKFLYG